MSAPIGDPRPAGTEGPAGDQRPAGSNAPAGDPRQAGQATLPTPKPKATKPKSENVNDDSSV